MIVDDDDDDDDDGKNGDDVDKVDDNEKLNRKPDEASSRPKQIDIFG